MSLQEHKTRFYFPHRPTVSDKCKDLVYRLMQEKDTRLCSRKYQMKDRGQVDMNRTTDFFGRYVFADDGEDIKAHRWFRSVPWDRLHTLTPPFVPRIHGAADTRYFDESASIDDMSTSMPAPARISPDDVQEILQNFSPGFRGLAVQLIAEPYDSSKLRAMDRRIEAEPMMSAADKEALKQFVRMYGQKERKRPRDRILRDERTRDVVLDIRKRTAFMGYTWRRIRPEYYTMPQPQWVA